MEVDLDRFEVRIEGEAVSLTHTELRILEHLTASAGRVCPREQIGVAILKIFGHVLHERFDLLGARRKLSELVAGL